MKKTGLKAILVLFLLFFVAIPSYSASINDLEKQKFTTDGSGNTAIRVKLGAGSDITLENGETISNSTDGIVCIKGNGGSNNEDICFDLESTANNLIFSTHTGLFQWKWPDDFRLTLGSNYMASMAWETEGYDNFQIGTMVNGAASGSGYISIMDRNDMGDPNRSPSSVTANPTLRVYSSDAGEANDYIEMYHDTTESIIKSGNGQLRLSSSTAIKFSSDWADFYFNDSAFKIKPDTVYDQVMLAPFDGAGNMIVITNGNNTSKDHDHATTTNPTLFIHSDLSPDTDNTRWMSLSNHGTSSDAEYSEIATGSGDLYLNPAGNVGIGTSAPSEILSVSGGSSSGDMELTGTSSRFYFMETDTTDTNFKIEVDSGKFYVQRVNDSKAFLASPIVVEADATHGLFRLDGKAVGINALNPRSILDIDEGTGYGQVTIDGSSGGCLMMRDTDDAGWTECYFLNGTMTCTTDADGVCDGS